MVFSKRFALIVPILALASAYGFAQASPPKAELVLPKAAVVGQKIKATVKVTFEAGWHGYQNPPTESYMIPVEVKSLSKGVVAKPIYPKGVVKDFAGTMTAVYEGEVEIPVWITLPKRPGNTEIKLEFSYQQCNDQTCLPPGSIPLAGKIQVKKK